MERLKYLKAEYTRLRSAAIKRVSRAREAGFGYLSKISGAEYLLPRIRDLDKSVVREDVMARLVAQAQQFLTSGTKLSELRLDIAARAAEIAATPLVTLMVKYPEDFLEFVEAADNMVVDEIEYLKKAVGLSINAVLALKKVEREYELWRRSRAD